MRVPSKLLRPLPFACALPLLTGVASAQWTVETLSRARTNVAATSVGDLAFFAGGNDQSGALDVVDIYDTAAGSWSTASLSVPRSGAAATSVGDVAIFAGGREPVFGPLTGPSAVVDLFDSSTGQWSTAELSQARSDLAATTVGPFAIFAGGYTLGNQALDTVDIYDSSDGSWSTRALSLPRLGIVAATVGDRAFFTGGMTTPDAWPSAVVDVFDASTGQWSTMDMPEPQAQHTAAVVGSRILLAGGTNDVQEEVLQVLDGTTSVWTARTVGWARLMGAAATVGEEAIFAGGVLVGATYPFTTEVNVFDDGTGRWRQETLTVGRSQLAATTAGGSAFFAGGAVGNSVGTTYLDVVDIYTPLGERYCTALPNSTGQAALLEASGSASLAANQLELQAAPVPDQPYLFFLGTAPTQVPFGDGFLCVAGGVTRILPGGTASGSVATQTIDLASAGIVSPGTVHFQCWYRDPAAGGAGFSLTDALAITFQP